MSAIRLTHVGVLVVAAGFAVSAAAQQVTMMTGPQGGSWIPLGGALKNMWESRRSRPADPAAAGRGHRQRARHRRGQGADRFRELLHHRRRRGGAAAVSEEGHQGVPGGESLSAVLPGRRAVRREGELVRRPQGQDAGHAIEGQHRRTADRPGAEDQRHDLRVARQGELPGVVHRCGRHDEGRPRPGVHARHHGAGVGGDGPRQRARRADGPRRRQDDGRAEKAERRLQQARDQGRHVSEAGQGRGRRSATRRTSSRPATCPRTSFTR